MRRMAWFAAFLGAGLCLAGCAAGRLHSEGKELEAAGQSYGAAKKYLEALDLDAEHADSKASLSTVAQGAYNQKLAMAEKYEADRNFPAAMSEYRELDELDNRLKNRGALSFTVLDIGKKLEELADAGAEEGYLAGEEALAAKQWEKAVKGYGKAQGFKKGYKDTPEKTGAAHYGWAEEELGSKRFRKAAERFTASRKAAGEGFKDAGTRAAGLYTALGRHFLKEDRCRQAVKDLRLAKETSTDTKLDADLARAEECSVTTVAVLPFENPTGKSLAGMALGDTLAEGVSGKVTKKVSEFVRLVERSALDAVLAEQNLTASGIASGGVSKIRGVRYLVIGKLTQVKVDAQGPTTAGKTATVQEGYDCQKTLRGAKKPTTVTCWRDITMTYAIHTAKIAIRVAGSVKVVDTKTGEQVATQALEATAEDSISFADGFAQAGTGAPLDLEKLGNVTSEVKKLSQGRTTVTDEGELASAIIEKLTTISAEVVAKAVDVERPATDPAALTVASLP